MAIDKNKEKEAKVYAPRAEYDWVPAAATVAFISIFVGIIFTPLFVDKPEAVIDWLGSFKGDVNMFIGICLGFFLKAGKDVIAKK